MIYRPKSKDSPASLTDLFGLIDHTSIDSLPRFFFIIWHFWWLIWPFSTMIQLLSNYCMRFMNCDPKSSNGSSSKFFRGLDPSQNHSSFHVYTFLQLYKWLNGFWSYPLLSNQVNSMWGGMNFGRSWPNVGFTLWEEPKLRSITTKNYIYM